MCVVNGSTFLTDRPGLWTYDYRWQRNATYVPQSFVLLIDSSTGMQSCHFTDRTGIT